jgi:hypothetical protein
MAGDCEEEVVVEWGKFGQFVFEHLWCSLCALAFLLDTGLYCLWEDLVWQLPKPVLEKRADDVGVVEVVVGNQVNVPICDLSAIVPEIRLRSRPYPDRTFARNT